MLKRLVPCMAITGLSTMLMCPVALASDTSDGGSGDVWGGSGFVYVHAGDGESAPGSPDSEQSGGAGKPASQGAAKPTKTCTVTKLDPQPPAENLAWEGHKPGDGAVYQRVCDGVAGVEGGNFWSQGTPPASAAVDPVTVAQDAINKMKLTGPDIGIVPKPGKQGLVGLPVWMWTAKTPEAYGPNTTSATAGAVTVTATAKVSKIVWDMGDGHTITCTTAGTPYESSYGNRQSPDCGYLYRHSSKDEPGQKYTVTATSTWVIDWNGAGQSGQLTQTRQSQTQITIGQLKVLN
ncbi:ATP/GTP-binding protein [Streptomyces noursei]|uniref:ATP/GTP-binding protein n=1 Tax=Streptomyces noursei TaxID=1971 RepID=UPI000A594530